MVNYRLIYAGLGAALIAVIALAIAFGGGSDAASAVPAPIEALTPLPGETVLRQTPIEVDMPVGYRLEMIVDGFLIPAEELTFVAGTGVYSWQPGDDRLFEEWEPGEHSVRILWNTTAGLTDAGEFTWTFRNF